MRRPQGDVNDVSMALNTAQIGVEPALPQEAVSTTNPRSQVCRFSAPCSDRRPYIRARPAASPPETKSTSCAISARNILLPYYEYGRPACSRRFLCQRTGVSAAYDSRVRSPAPVACLRKGHGRAPTAHRHWTHQRTVTMRWNPHQHSIIGSLAQVPKPCQLKWRALRRIDSKA